MSDRTINIAGNFKQPVDITNSLQNGYGCVAQNYSHAEGYATSATGEYSYGGGYLANAYDNNSYVWSGDNSDRTANFQSNGPGTYNIYVKSPNENPLNKVFINGKSLKINIDETYGSSIYNSSLLVANNEWTGLNSFTNGIVLASGADITGNDGTSLIFPTNSTANFMGSLVATTVTDSVIDNRVATLEYVKNYCENAFSSFSSNYAKIGNSEESKGNSIRPVYVSSSGYLSQVDGNVVFRGDSETAGGNDRFVYMDGGSITPSTANVGDGISIVSVSNGTFVKSSVNVGIYDDNGNNVEGKSFTYLKNGTITRSKLTIGSSISPIFIKDGVITSFKDVWTKENFGSVTRPLYLKNGEFALCNEIGQSGGGGNGVNAIYLTNEPRTYGNNSPGYIGGIGNTFIKKITGYINDNNNVTLLASLCRPTIENVENLTENLEEKDNRINYCSLTCGSLKSSLSTYYAPKFSLKVSGTGNVLSSVTFTDNSSISLSTTTAFTSASIHGSGTLVQNISYSGSSLTITKGYPSLKITHSNSGNVIASIGYNNSGEITAYKTTTSSNGGIPASDYLKVSKFTSDSITFSANTSQTIKVNATETGYTPIGIVGICLNTSGNNVKGLNIQEFHLSDTQATAWINNRAGVGSYSTSVSFYVLMRKNG